MVAREDLFVILYYIPLHVARSPKAIGGDYILFFLHRSILNRCHHKLPWGFPFPFSPTAREGFVYDYETLKATVPEAFVSARNASICEFYRLGLRTIDAYMQCRAEEFKNSIRRIAR